MKIPSDPLKRQILYEELVQQCLSSRNDRFNFYRQLRNYYLFGSSDAGGVPYNKISSTVETLTSFIYSPDSVKFNIHLGTTAPKNDIGKVKPLVHEINDMWRMTNAHLTFLLGLKWSLVFGSILFKTIWKKGKPRPYIVEPHQFGVLREDVFDLSDQEAFVHCYTSTKSQLEHELVDHPRKHDIMAHVSRGTDSDEHAMSEGMSRLILSGPVGGVPGSVATGSAGGTVAGGLTGQGATIAYDYAPRVEVDLVDMYELYVWNDEIDDYQMVTMASNNVVIYDRKQPGVSGISAFTKMSPELNLYDYFWGESFVAKLTYLQDWRTTRVMEIKQLLSRQADPPRAFSGFAGIAEEKMLGFRSRGAVISSQMPGAKVDEFAPIMPAQIFTEVSEIDRMFDDQAGIAHILQGKGEPGVRSKGQADLMARLGSSRPKARAMVCEESAEQIATLMLRCIQENSKQRFVSDTEKDSENNPLIFTPSQFTNDFEVRVDAHSSSPIFVEDRKADAAQLLESHAIDRATYLEMIDPPGLQTLLEKLKEIEAKEAEAAKQQLASEQKGKES